jgi:transcriptional regulator with XRE-family HTH domain
MTAVDVTELRRSALGDFLRSRREKLGPKAVGLPEGRRRRTAGLRREEVADLAGIGVDWYIRLEQGRTVSPSTTTIDALARALRLSKTEHAHLRALARPSEHQPFVREAVPDQLRRMIENLNQPAYVTGRRWDVLCWNAAAEDVFGFGKVPDHDRNSLIRMFIFPAAKRLFGDGWASEARRMVAQFRSTHNLWAADPAFVALIARLSVSKEFVRLWEAHDIRTVAAGRKLLHHPKRGALRFDYTTFQSNDDPSLKLVIYTPA